MGNIGDLYVNIHANARGLVSGLAHSQKKLRKFSRSAARMGRQMQTISRGMIGLGAAFAVPVTLAVREFAKFEKSMANVATMLDEPQKHMRTFNSAVSDMAVEFGETTDALAGGLYDILSASVAPSKALDVLADEMIEAALADVPAVAAYLSEEQDDAVQLHNHGTVIVASDPLDGSSNIDTNVSVGTIFSILPAAGGVLQPGRNQLAAGFFVYGPQTTLLVSFGKAVAAFQQFKPSRKTKSPNDSTGTFMRWLKHFGDPP